MTQGQFIPGKLFYNLLKCKKDWLFRFVFNSKVDRTNNSSEKDLRPLMIAKTSDDSRLNSSANKYTFCT